MRRPGVTHQMEYAIFYVIQYLKYIFKLFFNQDETSKDRR